MRKLKNLFQQNTPPVIDEPSKEAVKLKGIKTLLDSIYKAIEQEMIANTPNVMMLKNEAMVLAIAQLIYEDKMIREQLTVTHNNQLSSKPIKQAEQQSVASLAKKRPTLH